MKQKIVLIQCVRIAHTSGLFIRGLLCALRDSIIFIFGSGSAGAQLHHDLEGEFARGGREKGCVWRWVAVRLDFLIKRRCSRLAQDLLKLQIVVVDQKVLFLLHHRVLVRSLHP